jgi:DNA repair protein RecO (recombination protein O)
LEQVSDLTADAILCALLPHGEHNAVVRMMTEDHGLVAGYVRGGRAAKQRALLIPGNKLRTSWRARVDEQLGTFTLELMDSRAALALGSRVQAAALGWVTSLCASAIPERVSYPAIYASLDALLLLIEDTDSFIWTQALARFELTVLAELGFGLDLGSCAATGVTDDLIYVSPKSAQAVSRTAGAPYKDRLLPLPAFLAQSIHAHDWHDIHAGLRLSGHFIERHLDDARSARCLPARQQLMQLLATQGH